MLSGPAGKLTPDELNSLIAQAHRRIDRLNRELAEQRVREPLRVEAALKQQRQEHKGALERAVATALERHHQELNLEQNRKVCDWRHPVVLRCNDTRITLDRFRHGTYFRHCSSRK